MKSACLTNECCAMTGNKHSSSFRSLSTAINCRSDRDSGISCTAATGLFYGNAQQPKFATFAAQLFPSFCAALLEPTKLIKSLRIDCKQHYGRITSIHAKTQYLLHSQRLLVTGLIIDNVHFLTKN